MTKYDGEDGNDGKDITKPKSETQNYDIANWVAMQSVLHAVFYMLFCYSIILNLLVLIIKNIFCL